MSGLEYTERMTGTLTVGWSQVGRNAYGHNDADSPVEIVLTVGVHDLDDWVAGPRREASVHGVVDAPVLAAGPLVAEGSLRWYADDPDESHARRMTYHLTLHAGDGRRFSVVGDKVIRLGPFTDAWPEATTLRIVVRDAPYGSVIAEGVLSGRPRDLSNELSSMEITRPRGEAETLDGLSGFGRVLAGTLFDCYGGIFARPVPLDPNALPRRIRPLRCPLPEIHDLLTRDGLRLRLLRYRGGSRGPVVCVHGMGASSGIFTVDTIAPNLTEYLCQHGFDVWLLDWRASALVAVSPGPFTADDSAANDFPAAAELIRRVTGGPPHWIAHCAGSMALFMSALSGLDGIASVVSLGGGLYPRTLPLEEVRIGLQVPGMLERLGKGSDDDWQHRVFERAAQGFPLPADQRCASAACHRLSYLYSLSYQHENLNQLTHATMHERMGIANVALLRQLAGCVTHGRLVDAAGADVYLPNLERLRIPITFIHGERNRVWTVESTTRSYEILRSRFGDGLYRQHVLPDYGNLDILLGTACATETYPLILRHLKTHKPNR